MADINDLIAAGIRPPDIAGAQQHAMTLAGLAQQRQLQQQQMAVNAQQMQMGGVELQEKQRQLDRSRALDDAYQSAFTADPDGRPSIDRTKLTQALSTSGNGSQLPGVLEGLDKLEKSHADLSEAKGKVADLETLHEGELGSIVRAGGYDPRLALTTAGLAFRRGHVSQEAVEPLLAPIAQALQEDPTGAKAKALTQQLADRWIAGSPKQRELENSAAAAASRNRDADTRALKQANEAPGQIANAEQAVRSNLATKLAAAAGQGPDALAAALQDVTPNQQKWFAGAQAPADFLRLGQKPEQTIQSDQAAAVAAQTKIRDLQTQANEAAMRGQGEKRLFLESQAQKLRQETFNATIGQGLDANGQIVKGEDGKPVISPAAQMVADYDIEAPRLGRGMSSGMLAQVKTANPDYDAKNYATAKGIRSGKTAANIQALNTAIVHMDQLGEVGKALNNGTLVPGNALFNSLQQTFGGATPTNFEGLKNAVAGEMANALKGTATDPEIANISKTISGASSPDQLKGIIQENLKVLGAKLNTYDEQYHQAVGGKDPWKPVLPTAAAVLDKHGVSQKPQVSGPLPDGAGKVIDKATAKAFYDAAGGDPAKTRLLIQQKNWKLQ